MKTTKLTIAMALIATMAQGARLADRDTVKVINNPQQVVITEDSTGSHITILGQNGKKGYAYDYSYNVPNSGDKRVETSQKTRDWNLRLPFQKSDTTWARNGKGHWSTILNGLYFGFGWANTRTPERYPLFKDNVGHEYEAGILNLLGIEYDTGHGQKISLGIGLDWHYYRMHYKTMTFFKDSQGMIQVGEMPDSVGKRSSMLKIFSLQFPLMFHQRVTEDFSVFAGGIMNWNANGWLKQHYKRGDREFDLTTHSIGQRPITFDLMGGLSYNDIGLYVRYRPQNVLKAGRGPEFNTLSMGIIFPF